MCGSAQYDISKYLCKLMALVVEYFGTHCVKDSITFSDVVRMSDLPLDSYMCSYDVAFL